MFWLSKKKQIVVERRRCFVAGILNGKLVRFEISDDFIGKHSPIIIQRKKYLTKDDVWVARGTLAWLLSNLTDPAIRFFNPESGEFYDL